MRPIFVLLFSLPLLASVLITPEDALKTTLDKEVTVKKKSLLLKSSQAKVVEKIAKAKLDSKLVRLYIAKSESVQGYGVLLNRTVRTKKAAIIYIITPDGVLKASEVVAFKEPVEYLPTSNWMDQFDDIEKSATLRLGDGVSVITGATLSARTISDGARLAMAIFEEVIKR